MVVRSTSTTSSSFYDAVIVGGGMVGNGMACAMGQSKVLSHSKVLLLESEDPKPLVKTELFSNRTSAVSPSSVAFFKKIGVWNQLVSYRVKKVDRLEVIDSCSQSTINFEQPNPADEIAYIIENDAIVACLLDRVRDGCPNVTVKTKAKVVDCRIPDSLSDLASLKLNDGTEIRTSLVIGADGAKSVVRNSLGVDYTGWEYGQKGVVAVVQVQASNDNSVAWQRFTPYGPIALLPLSDKFSNLIWTTNDRHAAELLTLTQEQFVDQLNHYLTTDDNQNSLTNALLCCADKALSTVFRTRETKVPIPPVVVALQSDNRAAFPLGFGHAHSYVAARVALIGDAAHRIHPLGGQGVNLGWADVTTLTKCLEKAVSDGADLGAVTYLSEYDTKGQRRNVPVQIVCDWLNRIYRTNAAPLVLVRSLGLFAVNKITPLKNFIVSQTSG